MSRFEQRILAELKNLRAAEAALEGMYQKLRSSGSATGSSFIASLRSLDERVNRLESLLDSAA